MMPGENSVNIDWTKDETYDYTAKMADRSWAWEWLRRNPDFRAAWDDGRLQYGIAGYDAATTLLVPLKTQVEATPFLLRDLACSSVLLEMPTGPQHLLFRDGARNLQLVIEG